LPSTGSATLLPVTGEFDQTPGVANLNGIVAKSALLLVAQSNTGKLFRVDPATGIATEIDLGGVALSSVDGLELQGGNALRGAQLQPGDGRTARFSVSRRDRARRYH
jgi:hypothetical protein